MESVLFVRRTARGDRFMAVLANDALYGRALLHINGYERVVS